MTDQREPRPHRRQPRPRLALRPPTGSAAAQRGDLSVAQCDARRLGQPVEQPRAAHQVEHPGSAAVRPAVLLEAEPVGPGHQRPEQQLIVEQDHDQHGHDRA